MGSTPRKLLIVGCGRLGVQLATFLRPADYKVYGLCRNPERLPDFISGIQADVTHEHNLRKVLSKQYFDDVVVSLSAGQYREDCYRAMYVDAAKHILDAVTCCGVKRICFVSSSRVYGEDNGAWVDERTTPEPRDFAGALLLEAERLFGASGIPSTALRLGGIYGLGHSGLVSRVRAGELRIPETPIYSNRIHIEDAAGFIAHLLEMDADMEPLYIVSDGMPVLYAELIQWLAQQLGVPPPQVGHLTTRTSGRKRYHRRLRNARMLASGYALRYPDYRAGYGAILESLQST